MLCLVQTSNFEEIGNNNYNHNYRNICIRNEGQISRIQCETTERGVALVYVIPGTDKPTGTLK